MFVARLAVLLSAVALASGDVYMQTMMGGNNRLDEANRDRTNANRVFDSQNNNRGGVNVQSMAHYEGESIPMTWTAQHGCGQSVNDCQMVIQYMCDDRLRDGVTRSTIPQNPNQCIDYDCNNDPRYGMHESYDYYMNCRYRHRNRGLFTADRRLNGNTARFTRQNNNGARRGYECPEERDYYPAWHPTPWIDLAVLTTRPEMCDYYKAESENVKGRHYCAIPDLWYHHMIRRGGNGNNGFIPSTEPTCAALNNAGSAMINFLRETKEAEYAKLAKATEDELAACEEWMGDWAEEMFSVGEDAGVLCTQKTISPAELETMCPQCGEGFAPHPFPPPADGEPCFVCVPSQCAVNSTATGFSDKVGDACAPGSVEDLFNPNMCVVEACFNQTNTHEDQLMADQCRLRAVSERHLVENCLNDQERKCAQRQIMTADCYASNIPTAEWRREASHSEKDSSIQEMYCGEAAYSRWNSLSNGVNMAGDNVGYNFTYPAVRDENVRCALRIRYNITTKDYGNLNPHNASQVNSKFNKNNGNNPAKIPVNEQFGIPASDSQMPYMNKRGYLWKQNPIVQIFDDLVYQHKACPEGMTIPGDVTRCYTNAQKTATRRANDNNNYYCERGSTMNAAATQCVDAQGATTPVKTAETDATEINHRLAINTNQFGRTFQDRTHSYYQKKRTADMSDCDTIHMLTVRGKRGNIVQTFPSTEYDLYPLDLHVAQGDCIHVQWSGSNTNPNNNDGQGKRGTDRSNVMVLETIRGEGGRGAERYGGHGRDGTTWTTKAMEPGLEGYQYEVVPTMEDVPCPFGKEPHPLNFKLCTEPAPACGWEKRPTYKTVGEDGETLNEYLACGSGWRVDQEDQAWCVKSTCPGYERRQLASDFWSNEVRQKMSRIGVPDGIKHGAWGGSHPLDLKNVSEAGFLGFDDDTLNELAFWTNRNLGGEVSELDDVGTYVEIGVHKITTARATYHTLCTRNNNFSNRSQKGKIVVTQAPEKTTSIGSSGGVLDLRVGEAFIGVPQNDDQRLIDADYSVRIAANSLPARVDVAAKVHTGGHGVGASEAASDVLYLGPADLTAQPVLPVFMFSPAGPVRKRDATLPGLWGKVAVYNSSSVAFEIDADNLNNETCRAPKVQFKNEEAEIDVIMPVEFNVRGSIRGLWTRMTQEEMMVVEAGEMWISLWCGDAEHTQMIRKQENSGRPINVTMPISYTVTHGRVYYYPDTVSGRECMLTAGLDATGCSALRRTVETAWFERGSVKFPVGASVTQPAGGYYQVSSGSNLAVVVGVTVSCLLLAFVSVGSAVYFRRHPDKWDEFKKFGPTKVKSLKRNMASHV